MYGLRRAARQRFGLDEAAARSLIAVDGWHLWLRLLLPCVLLALVASTMFVPLLWHELGARPLIGMLLMLVGLMIAGPSMAKRRLLDASNAASPPTSAFAAATPSTSLKPRAAAAPAPSAAR